MIRCREDYGYTSGRNGPLLFGKVKIWGEIVEHEAGYRSEFARISSLDYGDPEHLEQVSENLWPESGGEKYCDQYFFTPPMTTVRAA